MPATAARKKASSKGEYITHYNAVRLRVVGEGNLKLQFRSLQAVQTQDLVPFAMELATDITPTRLANFISQRACLRITTTEINEHFRINKIIIFTKPLFTSYPG